jgi:hypothetical protein
LGAGLLVIIVVGAIAVAEARLYRKKRIEAEAKIESVVDTPLVVNAISVAAKDGSVRELRSLREAIAAAIQSGDRVSLLIPREIRGVKAFYEFSGWWTGYKEEEKISSLSLPRFVPTPNEIDDFEALTLGKIDRFSLKNGGEVRSFRRVKTSDGELIILIDTSRIYGDRKLSS